MKKKPEIIAKLRELQTSLSLEYMRVPKWWWKKERTFRRAYFIAMLQNDIKTMQWVLNNEY